MGSSGKAVNVITKGEGNVKVIPVNESPDAKKAAENEQEGSDLVKSPSADENDLEGVATLTEKGEDKWFANPKLSNHDEWYNNLSKDEKSAVAYYVSMAFKGLNDQLYGTSWDNMDNDQKEKARDLFEAINDFELNKSINLRRDCDFQIFGLPKGDKLNESQLKALLNNNADYQSNGFLSFTTDIDYGSYNYASGLVIDLVMPPNKGGGAWLGTEFNSGEREFLLNSNSVLHFDPNSVHKDKYGRLHVSATWVGQAADQVFSSDSGKTVYSSKKS